MNFDLLKQIMREFDNSQATSLKLKTSEFEIKLQKDNATIIKQETTKKIEETIDEIIEQSYFQVKSPLVGTYYASADPESKPFVNIGDKVIKGQTLCIIEAMKVLNEIKAPQNGIIKKINCENNTLVEYDTVLVEIDV